MKKIYFLLTILVTLTSFVNIHKFYVSVTQIDYVPQKKRIEITSRIFIDDLEKALEQEYHQKIKLEDKQEIEKNISKIDNYYHKKLNIKINKKTQGINYLAFETEGDVLIWYSKIIFSGKINTFDINNNLLTEIYSEQQNITHTNINSNKKSFLFTNDKTQEKINYKK